MKQKLLLFALLSFGILSAQIPTANLIGYYPFSGNTNDLSGSGNNGINNGATLTMDRFCNPNSAYSFNGTSNYIQLSTFNMSNMNTYSYSFWMKPTTYPSNVGGMSFCAGGAQDPYCQGLTYQSAGNVFAGSYNVGQNPVQSYVVGTAMAPGQWIHVVVIRNATNIRLFINGVLNTVLNTANTNNQAADYGSLSRITLGMRSNSTAFFNGVIDDLRIYSSALSQADVTALYNENISNTMTATGSQICIGSAAVLSASSSAANTISWNTSPTIQNALATGNTYTTQVFNSAGTYTYYAVSGCTVSAVALVTVAPLPSVSLTAVPPVICPGATCVITALGADTYSWNNNSTGSSISVSPVNSTTFTVSGVDRYGCVGVQTIQVTVSKCTDLLENEAFGNDIVIYPNPSTGMIYYQSASLQNLHIDIRDLQGRCLGTFYGTGQNGKSEIDMKGVTPGVYILSAFSEKGTLLATKKILIIQ